MIRSLIVLFLLTAVTVIAAERATTHPVPNSTERLFIEVATNYSKWGRVDDESRWAPFDCRAPIRGNHRFSESEDTATHGQKIYALYAINRDAYVGLNGALPKDVLQCSSNDESLKLIAACDQVIVKESFVPIEVPAGTHRSDGDIRPAARDGKLYRAGEKRGLFIMAHLSDASIVPADSLDDGWIYGTVNADGKSVTSAGRVATCMKCHQDAPHGRLFGVKASEPARKPF